MGERRRFPRGGNGAAAAGPARRRWVRMLRGYLLLPHLVPVLMVELAVIAFATIARGGLPPSATLVRLLLAMLGAQLVIGAVNELVDLPFDTIGQPEKPLPSGDVPIGGAKAMAVAGLALMLLWGLPFGAPAFGLLTLGMGLGLVYDVWLKRTRWSWLPYALALPLVPIWVFVALGRPEPRLLLLYPLGALATVGVHFAQALPDVSADRAAALPTATSRMGAGRSFVAAWASTLSAPLLIRAVGWQLDSGGDARWNDAAVAIVVVLLLLNVAILAADRRRGAVAAFPLVALATLVTALAFTVSLGGG